VLGKKAKAYEELRKSFRSVRACRVASWSPEGHSQMASLTQPSNPSPSCFGVTTRGICHHGAKSRLEQADAQIHPDLHGLACLCRKARTFRTHCSYPCPYREAGEESVVMCKGMRKMRPKRPGQAPGGSLSTRAKHHQRSGTEKADGEGGGFGKHRYREALERRQVGGRGRWNVGVRRCTADHSGENIGTTESAALGLCGIIAAL
jgi:hypothetical protein